jgi:hypothetical protein
MAYTTLGLSKQAEALSLQFPNGLHLSNNNILIIVIIPKIVARLK